MGYGRYYFARSPKVGGLKPIAASAFDAFHFRDGALPAALADQDGKINIAELVVETEDRAPVRLISVTFARYGVLEDGRPDPAHRNLHLQAAIHRMEDHRGDARQPATDVIDAARRFDGRRLDAACYWSPTEEELDALRTFLRRRFALGDLRRERRESEVLRRPVADRVALASETGPDWRLRLLAANPEVSVRAAIAANSWTPSEVLDVLRTDPDSGVLAALATNYRCRPEWLGDLARHPVSAVRAAVAANSQTPDHLIARMAWADSDEGVRQTAHQHIQQQLCLAIQHASSPFATSWQLTQAARDKRVEVRLAVAANGRLPGELIPVLARDVDGSVRQAIALRLGIEGDPARLFPEEPAPKTRRRPRRE